MPRTELFIGNLNKDITRQDIEDAFDKYGRLLKCEIKNKGMGSSFCFLEFEEERDAEVCNKFSNHAHTYLTHQCFSFIVIIYAILFYQSSKINLSPNVNSIFDFGLILAFKKIIF